MSGPVLIALITACASVLGAFAVPWAAILEQWSLAANRRHARKYVRQLWERGEEDDALKYLAWLHDPEHAPPELGSRALETSVREHSTRMPRRIESLPWQ